jgi:hypothetical protein
VVVVVGEPVAPSVDGGHLQLVVLRPVRDVEQLGAVGAEVGVAGPGPRRQGRRAAAEDVQVDVGPGVEAIHDVAARVHEGLAVGAPGEVARATVLEDLLGRVALAVAHPDGGAGAEVVTGPHELVAVGGEGGRTAAGLGVGQAHQPADRLAFGPHRLGLGRVFGDGVGLPVLVHGAEALPEGLLSWQEVGDATAVQVGPSGPDVFAVMEGDVVDEVLAEEVAEVSGGGLWLEAVEVAEGGEVVLDHGGALEHVGPGGTAASARGVAGLLEGGESLHDPPGRDVVGGRDATDHGTGRPHDGVVGVHVEHMGELVGEDGGVPVLVEVETGARRRRGHVHGDGGVGDRACEAVGGVGAVDQHHLHLGPWGPRHLLGHLVVDVLHHAGELVGDLLDALVEVDAKVLRLQGAPGQVGVVGRPHGWRGGQPEGAEGESEGAQEGAKHATL